jgi:hypothetical protein
MYAPLNPWQTRLLRLYPGTFDEPMQCDLLIVDLIYFEGVVLRSSHKDHIITYDALSYTWGDSQSSNSIFCNDEEFHITDNLFVALQHMRLVDRPYHIWVDAICINQCDRFEKNMQVRNMAPIYMKAQRVIGWIGTEGEFTDIVLDGISAGETETNIPFSTHGVYEGLVDLYNRPWFQRVWVQQEIFFARELMIRCGKRVVDCQTLLTYPEKFWKQVPPGDWYRKLSSLRAIHEKKLKTFRNWVSPDRRALHDHSGQLRIKDYPELVDTLLDTNELGATDPRDHVYAILGLTNTPSQPAAAHNSIVNDKAIIPINYSATVVEVYRSLTMYIVQRDKSLSVIEFYTGNVWDHHSNSREFPSWVVDWRQVYKQRTQLLVEKQRSKPRDFDESDDDEDLPDWRRTLKEQELYEYFASKPKEMSEKQGRTEADWFAQFCEDNKAIDDLNKLHLRGVIETTITVENGRVFCLYKPGRCFRPKSLRDGDIVVTFLVAERPCVLRPVSTSEYEIVDFLRECDIVNEPEIDMGFTNYSTIFPRHRKALLSDVRKDYFFSDIMEFVII